MSDGHQPPGRRWVLWRGAVVVSRYPKMAARRVRTGVLAVTTSGRSSAILHSKDRQLCKGFDMTAEPTTSGVGDPSAVRPGRCRHPVPARSGILAGVCYLMVGLVQARTRVGDDPTRHDLSLPATGPTAGSRAPTSS
jgi:hypothetical protein